MLRASQGMAALADSDVVAGRYVGVARMRSTTGCRSGLVGRLEHEQSDGHSELLDTVDLAGDEGLRASGEPLEHVGHGAGTGRRPGLPGVIHRSRSARVHHTSVHAARS